VNYIRQKIPNLGEKKHSKKKEIGRKRHKKTGIMS
jgi:hypothetical protein